VAARRRSSACEGSEVEGRQLGGAHGVAEPQPLAAEHGHARRRRHAARRRQAPRVARLHAGSAVADQQRRLAEPRGQLLGREGDVLPLAAQPVAIVAIERGVHLAFRAGEHGHTGSADATGRWRPWRRAWARRRSAARAPARALPVLTPIRRPGERPGPDRQPRGHSRSRGAQRASASTRSTAARRRSEWADADVENVLGDEPLAVHERHAACPRGSLEAPARA